MNLFLVRLFSILVTVCLEQSNTYSKKEKRLHKLNWLMSILETSHSNYYNLEPSYLWTMRLVSLWHGFESRRC